MTQYLAWRLAQLVPVILLTTVAVFLMLRLVPGDPAVMFAGPDAPPEEVEAVRVAMGLNQPLPVQYLFWLQRVAQGDFGVSYASKYPARDLIFQRLPATLELTIAALLFALAVALPTGIISALRNRSATDFGLTAFSSLALAIPNFWLGIVLIIVFALVLGWLPPGGRVEFTQDPQQALRFLLLPALTLSLHLGAELSRFLKASLLEVLSEDYVRTARAKGLRERAVILRHALRNSLVPLVTVLGIRFGRLLGGAIVIESVFGWPGVGRLVLQAIGNRDYTVIQGTLLLLVVGFVLINLLTDLLYAYLDPRIRLGTRR